MTVQIRLSLVLNRFLSAALEDQTPRVSLENQKARHNLYNRRTPEMRLHNTSTIPTRMMYKKAQNVNICTRRACDTFGLAIQRTSHKVHWEKTARTAGWWMTE